MGGANGRVGGWVGGAAHLHNFLRVGADGASRRERGLGQVRPFAVALIDIKNY